MPRKGNKPSPPPKHPHLHEVQKPNTPQQVWDRFAAVARRVMTTPKAAVDARERASRKRKKPKAPSVVTTPSPKKRG